MGAGDVPRGGTPLGVRIWICGLIATAVALAGWALARVTLDDLAAPVVTVLVVAIAVAEVFPLWDVGRPRSVHLTVTELFLGAALVLLSPPAAMFVAIAGSVGSLVLRRVAGPLRRVRRRSVWVSIHAVAFPTVRDGIGVLVAAGLSTVVPLPAAAAAGVAALTIADTVLISVVVCLDTGMAPPRVVLAQAWVLSLLGFATGAIGVLLGHAAGEWRYGWTLVAASAGVVAPASRVGMRLARERLHGRIMLEAALATGRHAHADEVIAELVAQAADALHCERVELAEQRPPWAELAVRVGAHGWLAIAERTVASQAVFDHRDEELLEALAGVATVALDNAALVEELEHADRVRTTLLAAAAHDLRNPISAVRASLETFRDHRDLARETADRVLTSAFSATTKANRLIHDLIVLERQHIAPDAGGPAVADVPAAVDAVLCELDPDERSRCLADVPPSLPAVAIHPALLERVLDNLVGNALRHTGDDAQVRVAVRPDGAGNLVIAVEDRGPGVPPEQRAQVLEPFARGATSASGFGLGLHITVEFVRAAGGSITIADREPGPGASFRVCLPVASASPVEDSS